MDSLDELAVAAEEKKNDDDVEAASQVAFQQQQRSREPAQAIQLQHYANRHVAAFSPCKNSNNRMS
jgi:hypothetical protein